MKILWLSHLIPFPPKTGALSRSHHLLKQLCQYHQVDVVAFHQKALIEPYFESEEIGLEEAKSVLNKYCHSFAYLPISIDQTTHGKKWLAIKSLLTRDPYTINWLKSSRMHQLVQDHLKKNQYDVIHLDTISLIPYVKSIKDIPIALTHHNIESHMLLRRADNEKNLFAKFYFWQEGKRLERVEKKACTWVDLNILCSDLDKARLNELHQTSDTATIPNGVDPSYFSPDISQQKENHLIFYGVMDFYPNTQAMMFFMEKIWPELKKQRPDVTMDIIGQNPPERLVQATQNQEGVTLHGYVDDLKSMINVSTIMVCPIMDGGGTKLKMLDSLSMKKAIVCHPVAAEGLYIKDGIHALFANTPQDFIDKILLLLDNKSLRLRLGEQGREFVEQNYDYKVLGRNLSDLYESLLSHPAQSNALPNCQVANA